MEGTDLAARLGDDLVGGWMQLPGSGTAELMGSIGFGFACIDTQHGLIGEDALLAMLQALTAIVTPALVRVASNSPAVICKALDRGADGVVVPLVDSAAEARAAVEACRFPPASSRSFGPVRAGWRSRLAPQPPEPLCIVMIETVAAAEHLAASRARRGLHADQHLH
ncbi:aldolase/citrate lyase family protein [Pseudonocardia asaccharolytica]|uniref:HpcH/HpaI aldolase/citrate lyase domain-containing protein n=1 Tax=Pseudonocardia asaccharolytica DSM 44247 = NBRC 16224 TaxID=1123024 RepID=A0A511D4N9_9PSEU|nr:aldolase/citrate lyase family protein [Pseudonocardia asaccharolytica]GEL19433.1 hypothetical protein PA7_32700 [Pseudonocardia asaccharolytica DSM 44247 = NBRC 16224]